MNTMRVARHEADTDGTKANKKYTWNSREDSADDYPAMEKELHEILAAHNVAWALTENGLNEHAPVRPKAHKVEAGLPAKLRERLVLAFASRNLDRKDKYRAETKEFHKSLDLAASLVASIFTPKCSAHSSIHKIIRNENIRGITRMIDIMAKIKEDFKPSDEVRIEMLRSEMYGYTDAKGFSHFHNKFQMVLTEIEELGGDIDEATKRGWITRGVKHIELKLYRDNLLNRFDSSLTAASTLKMMSTHWSNYLKDHPVQLQANSAALHGNASTGGLHSCWSCGAPDHFFPECTATKCERCGVHLSDGDARKAHARRGACPKSTGGYSGERGNGKRGRDHRSGGSSGAGGKRKGGNGGNGRKFLKVGAEKFAAMAAEIKALRAASGSRQDAGANGSA
jgi:hypothetical protein